MIVLNDKSMCCGCMACVNSCPAGAITCTEDENGFLYPTVDGEKCIQCGVCDRVCHFQKEEKKGQDPIAAFSLKYKCKDTLKRSTSGGAFVALSDVILKEGGIVVAASMDEHFTLTHKVATDIPERDGMVGTFYTQSFMGDVFVPVKESLENGVWVMFVGLPCQVAAIQSYLKKDYQNLLTVELLCHGVPSNAFFKEHVHFLEKTYRKKAIRYAFRTKKYGWNPSGIEEVTFEDGKQISSFKTQSYKRFFHANVSLRPSCHNCQYRKQQRFADITVGDFWGIGKLTGKTEAEGLSCLFANNKKGQAVIERAREVADIDEFVVTEALYRIATKPSVAKISPEEFWGIYRQKGYKGLVNKYCKAPIKARVSFELQKQKRKKQNKIRR